MTWWKNLDYDLPKTDLSVDRRQGGKGEDFPFRELVRALEEGETPPPTGIPRGTPNHQGLYRAQLALFGQTDQAAEFLAWQLQGGGWCLTEPFAPYLDYHTAYVISDLVAADRHGDARLRAYCLEWLRWTRDLLETFRAPDGRVIAPHPRAKPPYHYETTQLLAAVLTEDPPGGGLNAKIYRNGWFANGRWSGWSARMLVRYADLWHPLGERILEISTRRLLRRWGGAGLPGGGLEDVPKNWGAQANPIVLARGTIHHGASAVMPGMVIPIARRRPNNPLHHLRSATHKFRLEAEAEGHGVPLSAIPSGRVITFRTDPPADRRWDWRHPALEPLRGRELRWQFDSPGTLTLWVSGRSFDLTVVEPE